jgi:hypothetical protein
MIRAGRGHFALDDVLGVRVRVWPLPLEEFVSRDDREPILSG